MRKAMTGFIGDARREMVPHAGIEPALLSELDFESSASTSSANGARHCSPRRLHDASAGGNRQIGVQRAITYPCVHLQCGPT